MTIMFNRQWAKCIALTKRERGGISVAISTTTRGVEGRVENFRRDGFGQVWDVLTVARSDNNSGFVWW